MSFRIAKLAIFAIMIATVGSLMVGSVFTEQPVKAQSMTANMADSAGNMSETEDGSISAKRP